MVIPFNELLINLQTLVDGKSADCLLNNGISHNIFSVNCCDKNGLEYKWGKWFIVKLVDGQGVPAVSKLCCLVNLGPIKRALIFYVLDYNVLCLLELYFL